MNQLKTLLLLLTLTSCAATKYGFIAGAQQTEYTETLSITSSLTGETTKVPEVALKGNGFHLGISEELKYFITKVYYFQNSYEETEYTTDSNTVNIEMSENGIEATVALKIFYLQPFFSIGKYNSEYIVGDNEASESYNSRGYGVDLEFPIGKESFLYVGHKITEYENLESSGSIDSNQTLKHTSTYLGLRFNFATVDFRKGGGGSRQK